MSDPERSLATILFTDIVGSTEHAAKVGDRAWREMLARHHVAIRRELRRFGGTEIKNTGDGFLALFDAPDRAIVCAARVRDAVREAGVEIRCGIHMGVVEQTDSDVGGIGVHIAARVMAAAGRGEVLVSRTVRDAESGSDFGFEPAGEHELKGVPGAWQLFRVTSVPGDVIEARPVTWRRRLTRRAALIGGAAVMALLLGGLYLARREELPDLTPEAREATEPSLDRSGYEASVAVLPFEDVAAGDESAYFSEGMTEEIIGQLARVEGLKVISRTSVVALKGSGFTLPQIADTLGVRHVVEGSVRRAGNRVRVSVQLIDARTDAHLWSETYDRELTDIFAVQEEMARKVSEALLSRVRGLAPRGMGSRTDQADAYDAYLRGIHARQRRTRDGLAQAIAAFEEAIALDPEYAPAYAGLSAIQSLWVTMGYAGGADLYTRIARGFELADRAIALDPSLAEAYAARGYATTRSLGAADQALADFERAIELAPSAGEIRVWYGYALYHAGRREEAFAEAEKGVVLDPLAPGLRIGLAAIALGNRRYDVALREARRGRALEPRLPSSKQFEAYALLLLGRFDECAQMDLGPNRANAAMCLHSAGETERAAAIIDSLTGAIHSRSVPSELAPGTLAGHIAAFYAWVGDADRTLEWLDRAAEGSPYAGTYAWPVLLDSGLYDPVRAVPRFRTELERIMNRIRARVEEKQRAQASAAAPPRLIARECRRIRPEADPVRRPLRGKPDAAIATWVEPSGVRLARFGVDSETTGCRFREKPPVERPGAFSGSREARRPGALPLRVVRHALPDAPQRRRSGDPPAARG